MRRLLCFLLALTALTLFALLPAASAFRASAANVNVALGCTYTGTAPYTTDAANYPAGDNYRNKKGTELTDGVKGSTTGGNEWYAFYRPGTHHIDIDLKEKKDSLSEFYAEFEEKQDWGIYLPTTVTFLGSDNGSSFTVIGEAAKHETDNAQYFDYLLRLSNPVAYRYIRMEIKSDFTFAFLSEIEVRQGEASYEDAFNLRDRVYAKLTENAFRVIPETDFSQLGKLINSLDGVTVKDANGAEKKSGLLATGDTLTKYHKSGDDVYFIVQDGDLDGDGEVAARDYLLIKQHVLGKTELTGAKYYAADVNADGEISALDYTKVKKHVLNTINLYAEYGPDDGRGDVTNLFAGRVSVKDNITNPDTWDMTIKRTTKDQYTITSETDFGTITQTVHSRPWGTWNLGIWSLKDSAGTHTFATESTDWEYVYRAGPTKSATVFSGGNHANEHLRSLKFFDGTTGKEISLNVGESASVKQLRITEETKLYYDMAGDDGKYNYSESDMYCLAVRNYTIVGPQIRLEVDYDYQKDVYYGLSYTCMMPIEKKLGLYCAYVGEDGKLDKIYETLKVGDPSYNGAFYLSQKANRAILFGYGDNAKYRIDVRVDAGADTLNPSGKERARFWDMNAGSNKLYFCLYGSSDLVKAGSKRHTSCQWTMYVE